MAQENQLDDKGNVIDTDGNIIYNAEKGTWHIKYSQEMAEEYMHIKQLYDEIGTFVQAGKVLTLKEYQELGVKYKL